MYECVCKICLNSEVETVIRSRAYHILFHSISFSSFYAFSNQTITIKFLIFCQLSHTWLCFTTYYEHYRISHFFEAFSIFISFSHTFSPFLRVWVCVCKFNTNWWKWICQTIQIYSQIKITIITYLSVICAFQLSRDEKCGRGGSKYGRCVWRWRWMK